MLACCLYISKMNNSNDIRDEKGRIGIILSNIRLGTLDLKSGAQPSFYIPQT